MKLSDSLERYLKQTKRIRDAYQIFKENKQFPEHRKICDLYVFFDDLMTVFYENDFDHKNMDEWSEQMNLAGIKSHTIHTNLKKDGIEVKFDQHLLHNRLRDCPQGPESIEFHLHHNVIEDLLNFLILGTANQSQLKKGD